MRVFCSLIIAVCISVSIGIGCKEKSRPQPNTVNKNAAMPTPTRSSTQPVDTNVYAEVDVSPMDMSYYPPKYPQLKMAGATTAPPVMRIIYSRPHLQGRRLFEGVLKYGELWRLGANEATELDVFQPVTIGVKKLPPGRYTLYAIPKAGYWTIAVNNDLDMWGLKQDTAMDITRVQVPVTYYNPYMEYFTMVFEKSGTGAELVMAWDDAQARLPVSF
ncbi:MAG: DUF2911 domain-containing protein [Niabella sp.]